MQINKFAQRVRLRVLEVYRAAAEDDILTYAAALAYHVMLALFPFIFILIALGASLNVGGFVDRLLLWSRLVVPQEALSQVTSVVEGLRRGDTPALISLGVLGSIWAASAGVRSAMTVLNRAYRVQQPRRTARRYLLSIAYTLTLAVLVLLVAALLFIGPEAVNFAERQLHFGGVLTFLWSWLRFPLMLALLVVGSALAYSFLPKGVPFRLITPGSIAAIALWLLASYGFRWYISNFGRFNAVYGGIGAVIVLLIYIYLCALALLIGGELNAVLSAARLNRPVEPETG